MIVLCVNAIPCIFSAGQFFHDGVKIDVDAQLLYVPGHPPVPVEKRDLWKFMSKSPAAKELALWQEPMRITLWIIF